MTNSNKQLKKQHIKHQSSYLNFDITFDFELSLV